MAEPEMAKKKKNKASSSITLDSSLLPDRVSKSAKMAQPATKEHIPDWSLLPEELLQLISTHLEKKSCFFVDAIHARSVCNSWRSTFPFPSRHLLRQSYSLPAFADFPRKTKDLCTLEKIPLFLFRLKTQTTPPSEYFIGGLARDDHHMELLPSPIQCSVKANLPGSDPILMNMVDCQILPLGHHCRIIGWDPENMRSYYKGLAFHQGGEGGFVVILNYSRFLLVLRSSEMRWIRVEIMSIASCKDLYTFRGKFYAVFLNRDIFVIDPYTMEATPLMPQQDLRSSLNYLVPSGNEELFLIHCTVPDIDDVIDFTRPACKVSKLDEETGEWVVVNDLGDRVLFIGQLGKFACSGKELPDGCGLSGNSILFTSLFTNEPGDLTFAHKYGVDTGYEEDDLSFWRFSRENRVMIRSCSPPVIALRVERG